jgi:hypothetical protein
VKDLSLFHSVGEHVIGGLFRRSELPRRCREMPFALLARGPGMLGREAGLSPFMEPIDEMRFAFEAAVPVIRLALRIFSFFATWMALRNFRASIVLVSESDPDPESELRLPGARFSSMMTSSDLLGLTFRRGTPEGGDRLPVFAMSRDLSGGVRPDSGELVPKLRLNDGAAGDPSGIVDRRALFDRKPAENLLGFDDGRLVTSGTSRLGLDSSWMVVSPAGVSSSRYDGAGGATMLCSGDWCSSGGEDLIF